MKSKKLILPVLLGAVAISSAYTFASDETIETQTYDKKAQMGSGKRMGGGMFVGYQNYIDVDDLTGDTKTSFDAIVDEYKEKMKTSMESAKSSSGNQTEMQETMKTNWTAFMTAIRGYVPEDKLTEFDAFVNKGPQTQTMGTGDNQRPQGMSGDIQKGKKDSKNGETAQNKGTVEYKYITGNLYTKIKSKIESLSDDQLETLLSKVESTITNYQNGSLSDSAKNKAIQIYTELKQIINDQLGTTDDDAVAQINELFN